MIYALLDNKGDIGGRWTAKQARQMYCAGIKHWALLKTPMQVWQAMPNGDLLRYDGDRTRRLSDKIVEYRAALASMGKVLS